MGKITRRLRFTAFVCALAFTPSAALAQQTAPPAQRNRTVNPSTTQKPQDPEAEVIRVDTNLVNTLFTAVDKDRHFITSLRAEDVRIFENDVPQNS